MATDRLYSGLVAWLKIVLPLGALAILSSVVYFARGTEEVRQIPFVTEGAEEFERERAERPEYTTVTSDGGALQIVAEEAVPVPGEGGVYVAEDVAGRLETEDGRIIQATAPSGRIDTGGNLANLSGIVSIDTSDGYHILTEELFTRLDVAFGETGGPVWGESPFGQIDAGLLHFGTPDGTRDVLRFTEGVKVVYLPGN